MADNRLRQIKALSDDLAQLPEAAQTQIKQLVRNSVLVARQEWAERLGQSFDGKRNMYDIVGYPKVPRFQDFYNFYKRDGIAAAVIDRVSEETWRNYPIILAPGQEADDQSETIGPVQKEFLDLAKKVNLLKAFTDVDAACGYSRIAVIFLGLTGPSSFDQPAAKGSQLAYVTVYDEGQIEIKTNEINADQQSERYGLPEYYWLAMGENVADNGRTTQIKTRVHWSRVIEVKEGRSRSRIYGVPRLENILNRLYDLEKVVAGSSEAFWLLIYRGFSVTNQKDVEMPEVGSEGDKAMRDSIEEYIHGLKRYVMLDGADMQDMGGRVVSGKEQFELIVSYIAGSKRIPKRILLGSERGELASSQDDVNFADTIESRQNNYAEPVILRPFIDRMVILGILNIPVDYNVNWPSLFSLNPLEKSELAKNVATAINTATGGTPDMMMIFKDFAQRYLDYIAKDAPNLEEPAPDPTQRTPDQMIANEFAMLMIKNDIDKAIEANWKKPSDNMAARNVEAFQELRLKLFGERLE